ncbi:MAG: M23 family metallopeptidase [Gammaproteobacteria bacterium]
MNIILFTNKRGQVWSLELNILRYGLVLVLGLVSAFAVAVYSGVRMGENELVYVDEWQKIIDVQHAEITAARHTARVNLDALTLRLGQMQAELLRLNALGERLVTQADLGKDEFDFDTVPAMGGPQSALDAQSVEIPDFLSMLDELDTEIGDREQKLAVLETLLMNRNLRERITPSGRPVKSGWLSSKFGKRTDPFTARKDFHKGTDFAGKAGSEVIAVGDGVVTWAGKRSGYGNMIELNHGNGYVTRYGHNQAHLVDEGDAVKKGEQIALMGSSGRSTGPHVHFEVLHNGKKVDPAKFIGQ